MYEYDSYEEKRYCREYDQRIGQGFVKLVQSETDRRVKIAELTDAGKEFCLLAIADRYEDEAAISSCLSPEEDRILRILLGKLVYGLDAVSERK